MQDENRKKKLEAAAKRWFTNIDKDTVTVFLKIGTQKLP